MRMRRGVDGTLLERRMERGGGLSTGWMDAPLPFPCSLAPTALALHLVFFPSLFLPLSYLIPSITLCRSLLPPVLLPLIPSIAPLSLSLCFLPLPLCNSLSSFSLSLSLISLSSFSFRLTPFVSVSFLSISLSTKKGTIRRPLNFDCFNRLGKYCKFSPVFY